MKRLIFSLLAISVLFLFMGCASSTTYQVGYPAADELFITYGDDPGSESAKSYTPKGVFIHIETETYLPFPILGIFVKFGNAEPQYVFDTIVIPQVRDMGGDALTNGLVTYIPESPWFMGLMGMRTGASTKVVGQVVKR